MTLKPSTAQHPLRIAVDGVELQLDLNLPPGATGLVLFVHGNGSSRFSPRHRHVARLLYEAGLATALSELLTPAEEAPDSGTPDPHTDIRLQARRLEQVLHWLGTHPLTAKLPIGCFCTGAGAGAALVAAAERPEAVCAVVSRGGRPDLAGTALQRVRAPTLLLVGGGEPPVVQLHRQALAQLHCEKDIVVVPGATQHFEEPAALDEVVCQARHWFLRHLPRRPKA
jgi:dienelactone hydrolase